MTLEANQQYSMALASEKGASSLLTAPILKCYGFDVTKTEFRDGQSLRYGLQPKNLNSKCPCGEDFTFSQALHCGKGGYTRMRHNENRDNFAKIMRRLLRRNRAETSDIGRRVLRLQNHMH